MNKLFAQNVYFLRIILFNLINNAYTNRGYLMTLRQQLRGVLAVAAIRQPTSAETFILSSASILPLFHRGSSTASSGPVPRLEPVLPVSTKIQLSARKSGPTKVAPPLCWARKNKPVMSGAVGGCDQTKPTTPRGAYSITVRPAHQHLHSTQSE